MDIKEIITILRLKMFFVFLDLSTAVRLPNEAVHDCQCTKQKHRSFWSPAQPVHGLCCPLNGYLVLHGLFIETAKTDLTGQSES